MAATTRRFQIQNWQLGTLCWQAGVPLLLNLVLAALGMNVESALGQDREILNRRMAQPRNDPPDRLDRPRTRERSTHRGWEVLGDTYTIVCRTSREDAWMAAQRFEQAWDETKRLLDPWTKIHRHPDFGLGATEVTIDNTPLRRHSENVTTLQVIGAQMVVVIHVGPGSPSLQEQLPVLQAAAVASLLHSAHLDRSLPVWVCEGLATYTASKCQESVEGMREVEKLPTLDTQYWQRNRIARHQLEPRPESSVDATSQIRFLMEGYDCRHTAEFFETLRQTQAVARPGLELENRNGLRNPSFRSAEPMPINLLMENLRPEFESWKKEPLALQPVLAYADQTKPELVSLQEDMSVVLKLLRRFENETPSGSRTKVTVFTADGPQEVSSQPSMLSLGSLHRVHEKLTSPSGPLWATLDARGRVVLSTDQARLQRMFDVLDQRLTMQQRDNRWNLQYPLTDGRVLEGWMEENVQNPRRPIAKFALRSTSN